MDSVKVLTDDHVKGLLTYENAIRVNRDAFLALHTGDVEVPTRVVLPMAEHNGASLFKPCHIPSQAALGLKVVSVRPGNAEKGRSTVPAVIYMLDECTGLPCCLMNATYLTAVRTAAGSAVSAEILASPETKELVVFGAGLQAEAHIYAIHCVRKFEKVTIVNRSAPRASALAEKVTKELGVPTANVVLGSDKEAIEAAIHTADIVALATNSSSPLFSGKDLKAGAHVCGVGSYTPTMQETDVTTVTRAAVIVDTSDANTVGDIKVAQESGGDVYIAADLGTLVAKKHACIDDTRGKDITFFKSVGTAVQDIATAQHVYEESLKQSIGSKVPI